MLLLVFGQGYEEGQEPIDRAYLSGRTISPLKTKRIKTRFNLKQIFFPDSQMILDSSVLEYSKSEVITRKGYSDSSLSEQGDNSGKD